jgi:4-amino-4-deoxy-L-arabinose transferase-like glycosyltransferase
MSIPEPLAGASPRTKAAGLIEHLGSLGERQVLLLIIILAFLIRLYMVFHTVVIANDGVIYIEMAKLLAAGNFETSLIANYPPLYPIMIWGMHHIIGDWVLAGQAVSVIFSCLLILPLYAMIRGFFNARIALLSALFVALNPYLVRFSTDVLTEAPYIFLFVTAIWLGWVALVNNRTRLLPLAGLCAGLAYLTRPEGVGVFLIVAAWVFLPNLQSLRRPLLQRALLVGLMGVVLLAVALPYMAYTWRI